MNSLLMGGATGLSPLLNNNNFSTYNGKTNLLGLSLGFLAGGIAGSLLSNNQNNYGGPSPFNDFGINFNKH
jgi:hypothetical protein